MDAATWLASLPAGRTAILAAALLALVAAAIRVVIGRTPAGAGVMRAVHACEAAFLAALLAAMLALSFVQILLRNVIHTGWVWVDPMLRHLLLWIGFVGALLATRMDQHINVDAVSRLLSPRVRRVARTFTALAAATVCLFLMEATRAFVVDEAGAGTTGVLDVPTWCLIAIMPLALWGMAARFIRHAFDAARGEASAAPFAPGAEAPAGPALRGTPIPGVAAPETGA